MRYVVSTGDPAADEKAVDDLKREIAATLRGEEQYPARAQDNLTIQPDAVTAGNCGTINYYTRTLSYDVLEGRVQVGVDYHDDEYGQYGCDVLIIYHTSAYLSDDLASGEDLFWDQEYYEGGINAGAWDMGCKEFTYPGPVNHTYMTWQGRANDWFTDESINDTSLGCEWWGEEYTGSVLLDQY